MKVESIRPDSMLQESIILHKFDIEQLLKQAELFVNVACPVCESFDAQPVFKKSGFNFVSCKHCEMMYINPRPNLSMLNDFYATSSSIKHWNDKIFPASEHTRREQIFIPRAKKVVELCQKYDLKHKILVDVGAGYGTFCEEVVKLTLFQKVIAVEPSSSLAKTCHKKGLNVIEKSIEEIDLKSLGAIDVITNFELIEHLYSPKEFLIDCNRLLIKNGLIIITTPNIKGFDLSVLGEFSDNIGGPNHLNYFSVKTLSTLLDICNFDILEVLTPGKLDVELVRKKVLNGDFDISNNPFLKCIVIDEYSRLGDQFQQFLATNLLSSHLWIIAKKR